MGQFMAQGFKTVAWGIEHNAAGFVVGFSQEKGGAVPVFTGVGQIIRIVLEAHRLLVKSPAKAPGPGFQVREAEDFHEPAVIAVATLTPDPAVADQIRMVLRI